MNSHDLFYQRIKNYKSNVRKIQTINSYQCLIATKTKTGLYSYKLPGGTIILEKQIGSKSKYGVIFLTKSKFSSVMLATKLMPRNDHNYDEIVISQNMSKVVLQDKSPHFLLVYKYIYCNDIRMNNNLPEIISKHEYYIAINELADGNFKDFLEFNNNEQLLLNAYKQIMISILSFHYFTNGYLHNDCHYKNFLFHKIKAGGYFQYNIYGKNIYIENMGYIWMIWDFGLVKKDTNIYRYNPLKDYFRINEIIIKFYNDLNINSNLTLTIANKLEDFNYVYEDVFQMSDKKLFEGFFFKHQDLFLSTQKKPANIINKKPYIIA